MVMEISKIKLKNFRCFGPTETVIRLNALTAFIGTNSSGKTAVLQSLLKLFGTNTKDREIVKSDFHIPKGVSPEAVNNNSLSIEVILEFPELQEDTDTSIAVPVFFNRMIVKKPGTTPYVRIRLESTWAIGSTPEGDIETNLWYIFIPEDSNEEEKEGVNKIKVPSQERSSIQVIYVPAVREPSVQLKNAAGTILWRIMRMIKWPEDIDSKLKDKVDEVDLLFDDQPAVKYIKKVINKEWKNYHRDIRYTEANIKFNSAELEDILKKMEIEFLPSVTNKGYKIDSLGDGLRSLFYLSLVNSLLEIEKKASEDTDRHEFNNITPTALTVLAVEEPENHVSPHLLGRIINNLNSIAEKANAQILITSHTPAIIKRIDPESIRHLRISKEQFSTVLKEIKLPEKNDEAYKYIKEAVRAYPELYFARLVILGEGDSEEIVIPKLLELLGPKADNSGISIVPLGGRHVNHFWKLLSSLEIPYITLLDLDTEREGGAWGRIKYAIKQLLKNGHNKNELLLLRDNTILDDDSLEKMHTWELDSERLNSWIVCLNKYNVFFSSPLDIDFMMLETFPDEYKQTAPKNGGPRIPDKSTNPGEFNEKVESAVRATLKDSGGDGKSYSEIQRELMIWYNYLFLQRQKPSTHIMALSNIDNKKLKDNMPEPLKKLVVAIYSNLKDDPFSELGVGDVNL